MAVQDKPTSTPVFSDSEKDEGARQQLSLDLESLLAGDENRGGGHRWRLTPQGDGVERLFAFKTFKKTWEFMNRIATECTAQRHHPEWSNIYNRAHIRWTTHYPPPGDISRKDTQMARFCDETARELGEIESDADGGGGDGQEMAEMAQRTGDGGKCCGPVKGGEKGE